MNAVPRPFHLAAFLAFVVFSSAVGRAQDTPDIPGSEENASTQGVEPGRAATIDFETSGAAPSSLTDYEKPDVQPEEPAAGAKMNAKKKKNVHFDTDNPYDGGATVKTSKKKVHFDTENPYEEKEKINFDKENPYEDDDMSSLGKRKGSEVGETQNIDEELGLKKDEKKKKNKMRRR